MSVSPALSLLNSYDPTNPSSIDSSLTGAGLSDSYYQQGLNGTSTYDPGTEGPLASSATAGTSTSTASTAPSTSGTSNSTASSSTSPGLNVYQQSLASLDQWVAQTLITSALAGPSTGSSAGDDSSSVVSELEAAAEAQAQTQAQQQQSALAAAQSALDAGTNVDTSA
ncbi:MAG TPA: hypothetical protein VMH02_12250 [Verrucomicrobiae bacterium]|nr:hypothetical protein [Verrucomicrobiae bacterium]